MKNVTSIAALALLGLASVATGAQSAQNPPPLIPLLIESEAFPDGGVVPEKYAARGANVQPDFRISNAPDDVVSYAIIFHDVDVALRRTTEDVLHWIAWNIPGTTTRIEEGRLPDGAVVGPNIRGEHAYMGPGAPVSPRHHHYIFEFYALDARLDLPPNASRAELLAAMQGKIVAKAGYVGRYRGREAAP